MIYELREYVAVPGAADRLHDRFAEHTFSLFARHGIDVAGFWTDPADKHYVVYIVRFPDEAARSAAWTAFQSDPKWQRVKQASEACGPIVAEMRSRVLAVPSYWKE